MHNRTKISTAVEVFVHLCIFSKYGLHLLNSGLKAVLNFEIAFGLFAASTNLVCRRNLYWLHSASVWLSRDVIVFAKS